MPAPMRSCLAKSRFCTIRMDALRTETHSLNSEAGYEEVDAPFEKTPNILDDENSYIQSCMEGQKYGPVCSAKNLRNSKCEDCQCDRKNTAFVQWHCGETRYDRTEQQTKFSIP